MAAPNTDDAAAASFNNLPDELLLAIVERWLDRPARYQLIRANRKFFRITLPSLYNRRVKLSQRNIPSCLVDGKSPRLAHYKHAIRKAWLLFSQEDEEDVVQSGEDRVCRFLDLFGQNLISLVVMERLPPGCVPWFEDHDLGAELPEEYEPSLYLPLRISLSLQRCVNVASLDFVGLKFNAMTLLAPFQPSARFRERTGLGSMSGIRELGFERCAFGDDIEPHHFAVFSERLAQLGSCPRGFHSLDSLDVGSSSSRTPPTMRGRLAAPDADPRDSGLELESFERLSIESNGNAESDTSGEHQTGPNYDLELPSWRDKPDPLLTVRRTLARSRIPFGAIYTSDDNAKPLWAPKTPAGPQPRHFRSLALIRNLAVDMAKVLCLLQGGWCSALDELILLSLAADDVDLACIANVCPFLSRLDVGLDEKGGSEGVKALVEGCQGLLELYLDNARGDFAVELPEEAVLEITRAQFLECLWLPECCFSLRVGEAIAAMPVLRDLKLSGFPGDLDPAGILALAKSSSLTRLECSVFHVSDEFNDIDSLRALTAIWLAIREVLVKECPRITTEFSIMALIENAWVTTNLNEIAAVSGQ